VLILVVTGYAAVGVFLLVLAAKVHGPVRYLLGAVGLLGIAFLAMWVAAALLLALGWGLSPQRSGPSPRSLSARPGR
jgi:hypothetical protein